MINGCSSLIKKTHNNLHQSKTFLGNLWKFAQTKFARNNITSDEQFVKVMASGSIIEERERERLLRHKKNQRVIKEP